MTYKRTRSGIYVARRRSSGGGGGGAVSSHFSPNSALNKPIPANPQIHPDNALMISAANNWLLGGTANDQYKQWLGPRQRCFSWHGNLYAQPTLSVFVNYLDGVGYRCGTTPLVVPVPMQSQLATVMSTSGFISYDRIVWLTDDATGDSYESYRMTPPGSATLDTTCDSSRWNAVRYDKWPAEEKTGLGYGHSKGESASNILIGCGLLRGEDFDDLSVGSVIPHCLRFNSACGASGANNHPKGVGPANTGDGAQPFGIPDGARVQLDPAIDVATWASVASKAEPWRSGLIKILKTLQVYGMVMVDSSGGPGGGGIECDYDVTASAAGVTFPWRASTSNVGWGYGNGIPYDLMNHFRVVDWNWWTGA